LPSFSLQIIGKRMRRIVLVVLDIGLYQVVYGDSGTVS
jgi:hypothetical protein